MSFFSELQRRNVIRVAVAYLAGAWVLVALSDGLFPVFGVPGWASRVLLIALAIGFPLVLVAAWNYAFTSAGLIRNAPVKGTSVKRLDIFSASLVMLALVFFAGKYFWPDTDEAASTVEPVPAASVVQPVQAAYPPNSIAVLPFVNMSDDDANEYFSDGLAEELLNLLARVHSLQVISRSSSFFFKGKDFDIRTVADKLNVANVLEGSVRKSGDRVRITVQLIDTRSDSHLWSETYDRTLDDIFAIQDEIAAAVVSQLRVTLLGEIPTSEQVDPNAYTLYLQARHLGRQYSAGGFERSNTLYRQALAIAPDYAAAWSGLSTNYTNQVGNGLVPVEEGTALARDAAQKAIESNPSYAPAHANLGWIAFGMDADLEQAARHFEQALKLDPANTYIIRSAAQLLNSLNRLDEAILLGEYARAHDPATASGHANLGLSYLHAGRWDEAIACFENALQLSPDYMGAQYRIGAALLLRGEAAAAQEAFVREKDEEYNVKGQALAAHALGHEERFKALLDELIARWGHEWPSEVAHVNAQTGDPDAAFEWLERSIAQQEQGLIQQVFHPYFRPLYKDPRWRAFLERMGCAPEQLAAIEFRVTLP
jgi:TolB-like protein/cytochrome c-type biogenesis protein CcmH/NrfG